MKPSEKIKALIEKFSDDLSAEERETLMVAGVTALRLEQGEGFRASPVVSVRDGQPRIDACWMGMLAQLSVDQARTIGLALIACAAEAETDCALLAFFKKTDMPDERAASMVAAVRYLREGRQPVQAEAQEPSSGLILPGSGKVS